MPGISLRRACDQDSGKLWYIANLPYIRRESFSPQAITPEDHVRWWAKRVAENQPSYVVEDSETQEFVGYVRFTIVGNEAEISVALLDRLHGKGYGQEAIRVGCKMLAEEYPGINKVHSSIKADNGKSLAAFIKAGFHYERVEHKLTLDLTA